MENKITKIILICSLSGILVFLSFVFNNRESVFVSGFSAERNTYQLKQQSNYNGKGKNVAKSLKVFITGEVSKPGVYELSQGLRVSDAIKVAGGFTDAAKVEGVNLTKVVRDGMQIKVPALKKNETKKNLNLGEKKQRERSFKRTGLTYNDGLQLAKGAFVEVVPMQEGRKVCINTAAVHELIVLPGIYEELARRIIAYREKHFFIHKEELMNVKGIRRSIYRKLKDKVSL